MSKRLEVGSEVKIISGMPEFVGRTGHVYNIEYDGGGRGKHKMYRVMLDKPIHIEGIGEVTDDIWAREHLKVTR